MDLRTPSERHASRMRGPFRSRRGTASSPPLGAFELAQMSWRQRVQFVVLLQFAEGGRADRSTLAAIVPGANQRDLTAAVEDLLDDGKLQPISFRQDTLDNLVADGHFSVSPAGRLWLMGCAD